MSNQTPRQQIEAVLDELALQVLEDKGQTVNGVTTSKSEALDAILAVFKGLPAMQEEQENAGSISKNELAIYRNDVRRQILAELEHPNGR